METKKYFQRDIQKSEGDNISCFNCHHWKSTFPDTQRAKRTVMWDGAEPDWDEKSCEILGIDRRWPNREAIGELINKHQSGSANEVKEAIAFQCPEYRDIDN